jgi:hypothetical protein
VVGPYHYQALRSSFPGRRLVLDSRKRLVDSYLPFKVVLSVIMAVGPLVNMAVTVGAHNTAQYSVAFFLSGVLRALAWTASIYVLVEEAPSQDLTYNSWVLLAWWVLDLLSNSVVLVTTKGFEVRERSLLASAVLGTVLFFSNATLVLMGFFAPKQYREQADAAPPLSAIVPGPSVDYPVTSMESSGDFTARHYGWGATFMSTLECIFCCRRRSHRYSYLNSSLIQNDFDASGGPIIGTPSVIAARHQQEGGKQASFLRSFMRLHAPFSSSGYSYPNATASDETTPFTPVPVRSLRSGSQSWGQVERGVTREWSSVASLTASRRTRAMAPSVAAPVYTVSIPRWVLVDTDGSPVEIDSLVQGQLYDDDGADDSGHGEAPVGEDKRPAEGGEGQGEGPAVQAEEGRAKGPVEVGISASRADRRTSSIPDIADTEVAFEIVVRSDGNGLESEWDRDSSRIPSKWCVYRKYGEFKDLYDAVVKRFGPEATQNLKRPTLRGESGEELHVADVSADMRALAAFLRSIISLRLQCSELTEFLYPASASAATEDEGATPASSGAGAAEAKGPGGEAGGVGGGASSAGASSGGVGAGPGLWGSPEKGAGGSSLLVSGPHPPGVPKDEDVHMKQLAHRMRKSLPLGEQSIRLRTFKGVISGAEICRWLIDARECSSRAEAVETGTDLVARGLLIPVVTGYSTDLPEEEEDSFFSDSRLWLFRYGDKLGRRPFKEDDPAMVVLFAQPLGVHVPQWSETTSTGDLDGSQSEELHVVYEIVLSTPVEAWAVKRRYRDFVQLHKRLRRLGIVPSAPLPPKRWVSHAKSEKFLDERRLALEAYLLAVVRAAHESPTVLGKTMMHFLDYEAYGLCIGALASTAGNEGLDENEEDEDVKETEEFEQLTKALQGGL